MESFGILRTNTGLSSNVKVVSSGGNVTVGIANTSNVVVVSTTGVAVTGTMSATGNTTGVACGTGSGERKINS